MILSLHCAPRRISKHDRYESQAPARFRRRGRGPFRSSGEGAGQVPVEADRGGDALRRRRRHRHHRAHDDGPRARRVQDRVRGGEPHRRQRRAAMDYLLDRPKDGHTIALITQTHLLTILRSKGKYKYEDLVALARATEDPQVLMVGKNSPFKTGAGLRRRGQGQGAQVRHHARRQRRPHRLGGGVARREAPAAGHRAVPRRRRHRDQPGRRQHRLRAGELRRGRVADQVRRHPAARHLRGQPAQGAAQRADRQGNRRRRRQPVHGARLRHFARHAARPRQGAGGRASKGDAGPDVHHLPGKLRPGARQRGRIRVRGKRSSTSSWSRASRHWKRSAC